MDFLTLFFSALALALCVAALVIGVKKHGLELKQPPFLLGIIGTICIIVAGILNQLQTQLFWLTYPLILIGICLNGLVLILTSKSANKQS